MGHKLPSSFFALICIPGLCAFSLIPSQNPVAVGSNVTIILNETTSITLGIWLFGPSSLYVWYPGALILGSNYQSGIEFNSSTYQLTLLSVTVQSSGLYVLESLAPNKVSAEVALDVQEPVSNVTAAANVTNLVEFKDTVAFTCNASGSPLSFSWQNGSTVVTHGGRVQLRHNGRELIINAVTRYDEGPYVCIVTNNVSSGQSVQMKLNISYGPSNLTITAWPEKMVYASGMAISLSCSADSKPAASFSWMYNSSPLNASGPQYELINPTQKRTGRYTCVAQNAVTLRNDTVSMNITIVDPITVVDVNPLGIPVEHMPFNLSCNIVGPVDSIQWIRDGEYLYADNTITFSSNNSTMSFNQLALSDNALYQCDASNAVSNMTSQPYELIVNYGPKNTTVFGPDVAAVGSTVTFSCSSDSHPESQYSWYFGGSWKANGPVYVTPALSLNHSGQFTCMAFNNITGKSCNASMTLTVLVPVSNAVVNMEKQLPIYDQAFTLTCTASGNVTQIQWMKNGMNLYSENRIAFSSNNVVLNIYPLLLSDEGLYQCEPSNAVSNTSSTAYELEVFYGPWNTTISGPTFGAVGRDVTFNCTTESHPQSQYSWFFNDSVVGEGQVYVTGTLSLNSSGLYTCMAFNNITGSSNNASVELTVIDPINNVTVNAGNQEPIFSDSFTLTCIANGDFDQIQWMKNGMLMIPDGEITFSADNAALMFQNLSLSDDGYYQCEATNAVSSLTSEAYNLMVNYGPWNIAVSGPIMAESGSVVTFNCTADSHPESQYTWFLNSSMVGEGPVYVTGELALNNTGQYTCMAFNSITGSSSSISMEFTVIEAITSVEVISDLLILLASQTLQLTCVVNGAYNTIHWLRNDQIFRPSDGITFSADNSIVTFNSLQTADDGIYQCVATNILNQHVSQPFDLVVIFGPQNMRITVRPGLNPMLTCQALSQPPAVYHWLTGNNTLVGSGSTIQVPVTYILGSNYTCAARNPLTNMTVYMSQVINYNGGAVGVQASVALTVLLALLLEEWL